MKVMHPKIVIEEIDSHKLSKDRHLQEMAKKATTTLGEFESKCSAMIQPQHLYILKHTKGNSPKHFMTWDNSILDFCLSPHKVLFASDDNLFRIFHILKAKAHETSTTAPTSTAASTTTTTTATVSNPQ